MARAVRRSLWRSFSGLGLLLGALFFAASLTPSLIPRAYLLQGVLGGVCFAVGYASGCSVSGFGSTSSFQSRASG